MASFPESQRPENVTPTPPRPASEEPEVSRTDDAHLPVGAWFMRNGIYLLMFAGLFVFLWRNFGLDGMGSIIMVALGLGLVIFVHELGHFSVAKWCDVYVQTFSIGFGPALPGCLMKYGETVYKIALFPLGGYVQMLGEGTEGEEDERNPRSYKNKGVGQRMLIISAGVVMNIILACTCFIVVFMAHGKERPAGVIGEVEPGNRAWTYGIPSGAVLVKIGDREATDSRPLYFNDLLSVVLNSTRGQKIPLAYEVYVPGEPNARPKRYEVEIEPRKDDKDTRPIIGVMPAESVELLPVQYQKQRQIPYLLGSAVSAARRDFAWHTLDVVLATTDPEHPETLKDLPEPNTFELTQRWHQLQGKPMTLRIRRANGKVEEVSTEPGTVQFGDTIVGTTDPAHPNMVMPLPPDPRNPGSDRGDFFEYSRRLQLLAGKFMVLRVRHHDKHEEDLWVPPAYHLSLGLRMRMGHVVGVRSESPAEQAKVQKGDILKEVVLKHGEESAHFSIGDPNPQVAVDPVRLPSRLREWAEAHLDKDGTGVKVVLTVVRKNPQTDKDRDPETLPEVEWDNRWRFDQEQPRTKSSPMAIPGLGIAYQVSTIVEDVQSDSPAAGRLQKHDVIKAIRIRELGSKLDQPKDGKWETIEPDQWSHIFEMQQWLDYRNLTVRVDRGGTTVDEELTTAPDPTWPSAERGVMLMNDYRLQKAKNLGQAVVLGMQDTYSTITDVYQSLRNFATGRISANNMAGPIGIGVIAYQHASMGIWELLFFMGLISINLAVINFLPIPFLDGGHMVFLIYEKIRGRPASDTVQATATYAGLLLLLLLMVFVFYLDISKFVVSLFW